MRKSLVYLLILAFAGTQASFADTLVMGTTEHEGTFKGFADNTFEFELKDGGTLKENRSKVKALMLSEPVKASYEERAKKEVRDAQFLGYEKFKFRFAGKKKETTVMGNAMKHVTKSWSYAGSGGGGMTSEVPKEIPPLDLSGLEGAELTDAQASALARYKEVRASYDAFLNESTSLVKQMDTATGELREQLLTKLRTRKQDEQALKIKMQEATDAMVATFPQKNEAPPPPPQN